jgi:SAM-dependent methyltransferase
MTVSREDVTYSYRLILGREPESERAIQSHLGCQNIRELREKMMMSREFKSQTCSEHNPIAAGWLTPRDLQPSDIEVDVTPDVLTSCLTKIKETWTHLGLTKPHWSVLTNEEYLPETIQGSSQNFWESGKTEFETIQSIVARHNFEISRDKTAVEYGCGVGRVTMELSAHFGSVDAYDISRHHLDIAITRAKEIEANNIRFHECSDTPLKALEKCDFFFSVIVFQHNPPPIIKELIVLAMKSLKPGGLAVFQLPTYQSDYRFSARDWILADHHDLMHMHAFPQWKVFELAKELNCDVLEAKEDDYTGDRSIFVSNTFVIRRPSG